MRKMAVLIGLGCSALGADATSAKPYGFCFAPRAPSFYAMKPSKPYCAASRNCSQWQVDSYKGDIERYFADLRQYLEDVDKFRKQAYEYAACEAKLD